MNAPRVRREQKERGQDNWLGDNSLSPSCSINTLQYLHGRNAKLRISLPLCLLLSSNFSNSTKRRDSSPLCFQKQPYLSCTFARGCHLLNNSICSTLKLCVCVCPPPTLTLLGIHKSLSLVYCLDEKKDIVPPHGGICSSVHLTRQIKDVAA